MTELSSGFQKDVFTFSPLASHPFTLNNPIQHIHFLDLTTHAFTEATTLNIQLSGRLIASFLFFTQLSCHHVWQICGQVCKETCTLQTAADPNNSTRLCWFHGGTELRLLHFPLRVNPKLWDGETLVETVYLGSDFSCLRPARGFKELDFPWFFLGHEAWASFMASAVAST